MRVIVREFQVSSEIVASDPPRVAMEGSNLSVRRSALSSRLRKGDSSTSTSTITSTILEREEETADGRVIS
jgi:hypothetical protein